MFDAGSIVAKLKLDNSQFASGMLAAEGMSRVFGQTITTIINAPLTGMVGLLRDAASLGFNSFRDAISLADDMGDLAKQTGIAVETLNGLKLAATQSGSDMGSVVQAVNFFNRAIAESAASTKKAVGDSPFDVLSKDAKKTKEEADAFQRLGIAVRDAHGNIRPTSQILFDVADAMQRMSDGAEKSAMSTAFFSRSGASLIPMLSGGSAALREYTSQAQRLSPMTTEMTSKMGELNDVLGKVPFIIDGMKLNFAMGLMHGLGIETKDLDKAMDQLADKLNDLSRGLGVMAGIALKPIANLKDLEATLQSVGQQAAETLETIGSFARFGSGAGGALAGAKFGATGGSLFGPLGSAVGALIGLIAGGVVTDAYVGRPLQNAGRTAADAVRSGAVNREFGVVRDAQSPLTLPTPALSGPSAPTPAAIGPVSVAPVILQQTVMVDGRQAMREEIVWDQQRRNIETIIRLG